MEDIWKLEQSGRFTVTSQTFAYWPDMDKAAREFIAAATPDVAEQARLHRELYEVAAGESIQLPNGKRLEIVDMGGQI